MNKIRAWLKEPRFCFDDNYFSRMLKPEQIDKIYYDGKPYPFIRLTKEFGEYDFKFSDLILMKSTGLVDKNNKEIFEGDVIDIHQTVNGQNLFIITMNENNEIIPTYLWGRKYEYNVEELLDVNFSWYEEKEIEIVGNIYENKELLESEQNQELVYKPYALSKDEKNQKTSCPLYLAEKPTNIKPEVQSYINELLKENSKQLYQILYVLIDGLSEDDLINLFNQNKITNQQLELLKSMKKYLEDSRGNANEK